MSHWTQENVGQTSATPRPGTGAAELRPDHTCPVLLTASEGLWLLLQP